MNYRKILLATVIAFAILASFSVVNAGWFDNYIDGSTFKFECHEDYSGSQAGDYVILQNKVDDSNIVEVSEISKDNFTKFYDEYEPNENFEELKDVKEDDMRIVVQKQKIMNMDYTIAKMKKDESYYSVTIQHSHNPDLIDKDIRIVKGIYDTIEPL